MMKVENDQNVENDPNVEAFAWLRERAPSAGRITLYDDPIRERRVVVLDGATPEDVERVRAALGLRFYDIPWHVTDGSEAGVHQPRSS